MNKTKTSTTKKHQKRQKTDWSLFFKLCKEGKSNEEIAAKLGWKLDPKSTDPTKRVRAAKSLARTKGIRVDGKLVRLHDSKLKGVAKPKVAKVAKKKATKKKPKQKTAKSSEQPQQPVQNTGGAPQ